MPFAPAGQAPFTHAETRGAQAPPLGGTRSSLLLLSKEEGRASDEGVLVRKRPAVTKEGLYRGSSDASCSDTGLSHSGPHHYAGGLLV